MSTIIQYRHVYCVCYSAGSREDRAQQVMENGLKSCLYVQGGADKLGQNSFFYYGFVYGRIWLKFCKNINKTIT